MFLALRELTFARTRFLLMGLVVALIALLTVVLSGLSSGLIIDGVSGLKALPATHIAFAEGTKTDNAFSRSVVDEHALDVWSAQDGIEDAALLGSTIVHVTRTDGLQLDLTLFGVEPGSFVAPTPGEGEPLGPLDGVVVSSSARDDGLEIGDTLVVERLDTELRVIGFTDGQATFGHVDIAYLPLDTWRLVATGTGQAGPPTQTQVDALSTREASVVALATADGKSLAGAGVDAAAVDAEAGTTTRTVEQAFASSPGYTAETMTLQLIQVFLYVICAMVVGAFFTVWTIQRGHELAVLRAVGASGRFLVRDSLIQAAVLLVVSTLVGVALGVGLGLLMPAGMPFVLETAPIVVATALTVVLGLAGAAFAVLRVLRVDPLNALGGAR